MKIYGIPNCDTVKKARTWLIENKIEFEFYDYKKQGITAEKLNEWVQQKGIDKIINKAGTSWKKLTEQQKLADNEEIKKMIIQNPSLIKRPIVEIEEQIQIIGYKPEWYTAFFNK
jgi:arsenate reductase